MCVLFFLFNPELSDPGFRCFPEYFLSNPDTIFNKHRQRAKAVYWRYAAVGTLPDVHAHNHMIEEEGVNE